MAAIGASQYDL